METDSVRFEKVDNFKYKCYLRSSGFFVGEIYNSNLSLNPELKNIDLSPIYEISDFMMKLFKIQVSPHIQFQYLKNCESCSNMPCKHFLEGYCFKK